MSSPLGQAVAGIIQSYADGIDAGEELQQRKLDTILAAYDRALEDPNARIPTFLHAALEAARTKAPPGPSADSVAMRTQRGVSSTEYTLQGSLREVLGAIRVVFENFPALGYGTFVHSMTVDYETHQYVAVMTRANSCE